MAEPSDRPEQVVDLDRTQTIPGTPEGASDGALDPPTAPALRSRGSFVPPPPPSTPAPELPPAAPFSTALELPGYALDAPLGHGGMAEVWRARRLGAAGVAVPCVVKTILSGKEDDPRFQEKFLEEARIYAQLRHPNLVQVLDVGLAGSRLFLAMEWIEGLDAADLIRASRTRHVDIPFRHVLFILKETLQGLHHAHTAGGSGFVHRDISPGNILISRQGAVKLADFGVARAVRELADSDGRRTMAGKLHYFAPELVTGAAAASVRSDLFALGVTFYELLTCAPLFDRRARWPVLRRTIASFDPAALIERDLGLPDGVDQLLLRALAPAPADRYSSALEFLEDVNDYAYETGLRLLDAHFATYVERVLALRDDHRKTLLAGAGPGS